MARIGVNIWESKEHNQMSLSSQESCAAVYKQLFTGAEWDAIAFAMKDYGDFHGGIDETIANSVQAKIAKIFELTASHLPRRIK